MTQPSDDTLIQRVANSFEWSSSEVDWCERNFAVTLHIIEFWNTISNLPFFILPPILIVLFRDYGKNVTQGVHLIWILLLTIGIGSAYFHATLSLFGQMWDELAILWALVAAGALWLPKSTIPLLCNQSRFILQLLILLLTIAGSFLFTVVPFLNRLMLFSIAVPAVYVFNKQHHKWSKTSIAKYQAVLTMTLFFVACACWVSDMFLCSIWMTISFEYLHAVWHVLIALCSHKACVLMAYYYALEDKPMLVTELKLWPENYPQILAIPYVNIAGANNNSKLKVPI